MAQSQAMQLLTSHETAEWYTPAAYVDLARQVLGGIDLDPASNAVAQQWVKAEAYYTEAQNGLVQPWRGRVWLNPPYGKLHNKSLMDVWARKLEAEYLDGRVASAVLLVNSTHGYAWYERLFERWPVCLARERIRFVKPDGTQGDQAKRSQSFFYFGPEVARFQQVFAPIGRVILPEGVPSAQADLFTGEAA